MAPLTFLSLLPPWLPVAAASPLTPRLPLLLATAAALLGAWALVSAVRLLAAYRVLSVWPSPPTTHWFFGHGPTLATPAHHLILSRWARTYGRVYTLRVAWKRALVVTDPALANAILDARPAKTGLDKGGLYSRFNALNPDPQRGTVFTSPSDAHWAAVRTAVAPCFTPRAVKWRYGALSGPPAAAAAWLAAKAAGGAKKEEGGKAGLSTTTPPPPPPPRSAVRVVFDADDLMMRAALDAVASSCFGLTCGAVPEVGKEPQAAIFETMRACQDWLNVTAMAPWAGALPGMLSPAAKKGRAAMVAKRAYALELAATLKEKGGKEKEANPQVGSTPDPPSATAALLSIIDPETDAPLALPRLAGEAVTLLEAGFETTGHTAAYTLALLARDQACQDTVLAELASAGLLWADPATPGRALTHADLGTLPFLAACVKEAMRLLPVVGDGPVRTAGRTVTLGSGSSTLAIPADTMVFIPFFAAGRDAGAWGGAEEADAFRPGRWLEEEKGDGGASPSSSTTPHHLADRLYAPFSRGVRNCVGAVLGQAMAVTLVASVLARVRVGRVPGECGSSTLPPLEEGLEIRLTLQPKKLLLLTATPHGGGGEGVGIKAVKA